MSRDSNIIYKKVSKPAPLLPRSRTLQPNFMGKLLIIIANNAACQVGEETRQLVKERLGRQGRPEIKLVNMLKVAANLLKVKALNDSKSWG